MDAQKSRKARSDSSQFPRYSKNTETAKMNELLDTQGSNQERAFGDLENDQGSLLSIQFQAFIYKQYNCLDSGAAIVKKIKMKNHFYNRRF